MPTGLVMRSTGSRYLVRGDDGTLHECVAKGNLRIKGWKSTNPVAVGDRVDFSPQEDADHPGAITDLHDRRNYLVRRSVNLSHHKHVIAANLDQALLIVTVARPRTSTGFIDRFLVTAEAYQVPVVLVVNKVDDLADDEMEDLAELVDTYQQAGYRVLMTSARTGAGVDDVRELLAGRVTLVAGHSGVGKSTLINSIDPALDLHTAVISEASEKGQHTTTYAEMFELGVASDELRVASDQPADTRRSSLATQAVIPPTFIIDTPGIKGFGLVDLEAEDIGDQFPEIFRLKGGCRFNNCLHKDEPGCAVRAAVEAGELAGSRYSSYRDMLEGIDEESPYRLD
ncbi:MAG: ribosome small subunit-dependent GTPase A [Flavobacteriales bacterium]|jgi:ribosome biogenesis GTPase|nr:ribosome small subunit-dependent GTPase A [Flavobacteriales bacterium]MBK7943543.1 ribosome small subunit-dependent GTPase A [Flavobacteriales bacterium]MBK8950646.1 ribosome small subunit-dependent GTPase A [Flavobacteriales bacterium]MBK9699771.1 ribosome small subunit-dependent GTPase A [Flavobacteriales bacterium]